MLNRYHQEVTTVERSDLEEFGGIEQADTRNPKEEIWQLEREIKRVLGISLGVSGVLTLIFLLIA